jgi:hypothetical protein
MPTPRTRAPSTTTGTDALLYCLFGVLGAALAFGSLAWLTGNLANTLLGTGPWAPYRTTDAVLHPGILWPHLSPIAVLLGARVIPGPLTIALAVTGCSPWLRLRGGGGTNGLARTADLAPLLAKDITAKVIGPASTAWRSHSDEAHCFCQVRPPGTQTGHALLLVSHRDPADQYERVIGSDYLADRLAIHRPHHLGATVHSFRPEQEHDRLQVHPHIRPLSGAHRPVEVAEQYDRRPERLRVQGADLSGPVGVVAFDPQCFVPLGGCGGEAVQIRRIQLGRIHRILPFIARVTRLCPGRRAPLQFRQGLTGHDIHVPRLEVPTRRSPRRRSQHSFEHLLGYRLIAERPHGPATIHGLVYIHAVSTSHSMTTISSRGIILQWSGEDGSAGFGVSDGGELRDAEDRGETERVSATRESLLQGRSIRMRSSGVSSPANCVCHQ